MANTSYGRPSASSYYKNSRGKAKWQQQKCVKGEKKFASVYPARHTLQRSFQRPLGFVSSVLVEWGPNRHLPDLAVLDDDVMTRLLVDDLAARGGDWLTGSDGVDHRHTTCGRARSQVGAAAGRNADAVLVVGGLSCAVVFAE